MSSEDVKELEDVIENAWRYPLERARELLSDESLLEKQTPEQDPWFAVTLKLARETIELERGERFGLHQIQEPFSSKFEAFLMRNQQQCNDLMDSNKLNELNGKKRAPIHVADDGISLEQGQEPNKKQKISKVPEEILQAEMLSRHAQWDEEQEELVRSLLTASLSTLPKDVAKAIFDKLSTSRPMESQDTVARILSLASGILVAPESINMDVLIHQLFFTAVKATHQAPTRNFHTIVKDVCVAHPSTFVQALMVPFLLWSLNRADMDDENDVPDTFQCNLMKDLILAVKRVNGTVIDETLECVFEKIAPNFGLNAALIPLFQAFVNEKPVLKETTCTNLLQLFLMYATQLKMGDASQTSSQGHGYRPPMEEANKMSMLLFTVLNKMRLDKQLHLPLIAQALQDLNGRMTKKAQTKLSKLME